MEVLGIAWVGFIQTFHEIQQKPHLGSDKLLCVKPSCRQPLYLVLSAKSSSKDIQTKEGMAEADTKLSYPGMLAGGAHGDSESYPHPRSHQNALRQQILGEAWAGSGPAGLCYIRGWL